MIVALVVANTRLQEAAVASLRVEGAVEVRVVERGAELGPAAVVVAWLESGDEREWVGVFDGATIPVVAIGARPVGWSPGCWFPRLPSPPLLIALLRDLAGTAPPTRSSRRKSDLIIGDSKPMRDVRSALDLLARSDASVLVTGESGTGKELVARALHFSGRRAHGPWIALNCAAIPESLFEAELFGYERGAFTDARRQRIGCFEAAHGGTLFLDEIGELPLALQAKFLRVLETGEVTRLGGNTPKQCDVRLVSATNRRIEEDLRRGAFREDLYYRIRVFPLEVPPLRDRLEDVPELVAHALATLAEREHRAPPAVSSGALGSLLAHAWPGNVRELFNVLQRAMLVAGGGAIEAEHLALPIVDRSTRYLRAKAEFDARYYSELLRSANGNVSLVARIAGRGRKEVYLVLKKLGLVPPNSRRRFARPAVGRAAAPRRKTASGVRPAVAPEDFAASEPEEKAG